MNEGWRCSIIYEATEAGGTNVGVEEGRDGRGRGERERGALIVRYPVCEHRAVFDFSRVLYKYQTVPR